MYSRKATANEDEFVCAPNKARRATETVKIRCEHRWIDGWDQLGGRRAGFAEGRAESKVRGTMLRVSEKLC